MVDFGLKLEDNKVSDWNEYYIQYEILKTILKKCEAASKKYEELAQRRPETAAIVANAYHRGEPTPSSSRGDLMELTSDSRTVSNTSLHALGRITEEKTDAATTASDTPINTQQHSTKLVDYGSVQDTNGNTNNANNTTPSSFLGGMQNSTSSSSNAITRALMKATSGVSDYYYGRYEKNIRDTLKTIDKLETEFGETLIADIKKVNDFYKYKVGEIHEQITYLRESVQPAFHNNNNKDDGSSDCNDSENDKPTPLVTARKSSPSPILLVRKIASWTHPKIRKIGGERDSMLATVDPLLPSDKCDDEDEMDEETFKKVQIAESVQRAIVDHYRTAKLLQNFVIMNYTGFVKIVKKHDKTVTKELKGKFNDAIRPSKICNEGKEVDAQVDRMERLYAAWFCDGDISSAKAQILTKRGDGLEMDWSQLRLGYRMGMSAVLAIWVFWDCVWGLVTQGQSTLGGRTAFPVFRACGGLLQLQWCWGISVWVWSRYRINYIFLFDFDPNLADTPISIFNAAVDNTLVLLLCTLLYYKAGAHDIPGNIPPGVFAVAVVIYTVIKLIFPLRVRGPMWRSIFKVVTAPCYSPNFFQGYVGDIFTSMVKILQDIVWTIFFIASGDWRISEQVVEEDSKDDTLHLWSKTIWYKQILIPIVTLLPLCFRFNQCLRRYADTGTRVPHLPNAAKYALSQLVSLFGAFHPLYMKTKQESEIFQGFWTFLFVASSLYSFYWDVFMDWGLGDRKYGFLAKSLMFPKRNMYYLIMAIDLVLRFAWVLTLIPPSSGAKFALPAYLTLVSMMLELFRRTLWGFLRLEHEHRSNASGYRRVDFVPLHFATGHKHSYKKDIARSGFSVLAEVLIFATLVVCAAIVSVVAAQQATERSQHSEF